MKILFHACCGVCSLYPIKKMREEGKDFALYYTNPNIHPYIEYKTRRDCLKDYLKSIKVKGIFKETYGLDEFCKNVVKDIPNRCVNYCYRARLSETVKFAKENGYEFFSTTLLVSPYQKHEELKAVCEELSSAYGVKFLYRDFRVGFREGQKKARELGMYMQKYCGCIFSEEDRYQKQILRDLEQGLIEL